MKFQITKTRSSVRAEHKVRTGNTYLDLKIETGGDFALQNMRELLFELIGELNNSLVELEKL